ncbi:MAG: cupin domain-containing protein [Gammaproteobacteria bacterium]
MTENPYDQSGNGLQAGNIFIGLPATLPDEKFETLLQNPHLRIERIISQGHVTPADTWYDQEDDEWVLLLQGSAALQFENRPATLEMHAGDYVFIPAHCKHRVTWTDAQQESIWLAIHMSANRLTVVAE